MTNGDFYFLKIHFLLPRIDLRRRRRRCRQRLLSNTHGFIQFPDTVLDHKVNFTIFKRVSKSLVGGRLKTVHRIG